LAAYFVWACVFGMENNGDLLRHYLPNYLLYCPEFPIFHHNFTVPFGQAWSLGIEEKFYLIWPLLAFWWLARSRYRAEVTVGLLAVTAGLTAANGLMAQMWGSYTDILIGCLLALLLQERAIYKYFRWLGRTEVTCAVLVLLGVALLSRFTGNPDRGEILRPVCRARDRGVGDECGPTRGLRRQRLAGSHRRLVLRHLSDAPYCVRCGRSAPARRAPG